MRFCMPCKEGTKSFLRHCVFVCLLSLSVPVAGHPVHEGDLQPALYGHSHSTVTDGQSVPVQGHASVYHPYSEEFWLLGSLIISLGGVVMLNLILHRKSRSRVISPRSREVDRA